MKRVKFSKEVSEFLNITDTFFVNTKTHGTVKIIQIGNTFYIPILEDEYLVVSAGEMLVSILDTIPKSEENTNKEKEEEKENVPEDNVEKN